MTKHHKPLSMDLSEFDVSIDKHKLDEEWEAQPVLMHHYADLLANARYQMDVARSHLKQAEASIAIEIRSAPGEYGFDKITEAALASAVILQPAFKKAEGTYLIAKREVDRLTAIVDSLDHRKKALESLVYLHGQDYFAEPSARRAGQTGMDKINNPPRAKGIRNKKGTEE